MRCWDSFLPLSLFLFFSFLVCVCVCVCLRPSETEIAVRLFLVVLGVGALRRQGERYLFKAHETKMNDTPSLPLFNASRRSQCYSAVPGSRRCALCFTIQPKCLSSFPSLSPTRTSTVSPA